jgi:phenylacetate-CoA ligase
VHPLLVRHFVSPSLERLLGRRTFRNLAELDEEQWWSTAQLRELQAVKLRDLVRVASGTAYYRRIQSDLGLSLEEGCPFQTLRALPLLDKQAIRAHLREMTNFCVPGGARPFNTGGSSGEPLTFYVDRRRIGYDKAARMLTHAWFGARAGDRELYLWGSPIEIGAQDVVKRWRDRLTNELLLDAFNLSPRTMPNRRTSGSGVSACGRFS